MRKKEISILLALTMLLSLLSTTAFAAVKTENDWDIFDAADTDNLPDTQEQIFKAMIQNEQFAGNWATIANSILPQSDNFKDLDQEAYSQVTYTAKGLQDAVSQCIEESALLEETEILDSLPDTETPVYYVSTRKYTPGSLTHFCYYIQLFYDFEIEGIPSRFTSPEVKDNDTVKDLEDRGYSFSLGGSSDSYQVTAENRNNFENTVEKSYSYQKSTTTSTTVSNTYSKSWSEETTVSVEFSIPIFAALDPKASVEQKFIYSYGMDKTYETSAEESYSQSIEDTISVPLPAHTGIDIKVDVTDSTTTIPYSGAVRIKYKTMILSVSGTCWTLDGSWLWSQTGYRKYTFGRNGNSAVEDLDDRILNRSVDGYDPDGLDMASLYDGDFKTAADALRSGQPVAPYFGNFHYTSKNTVITPNQVYPLYPLDRLVSDTESVELYKDQEMRLDGIKIDALDAYDVTWYGFNARLSGAWTVVDENGDDASEYAQITTNRNGYPVLKALKPNDGKELFLRYQPDSSIKTTAGFWSNLIELTILPVKLSSVTLAGSFDPFYLNDGTNTADVSGLTVTAKDADNKDFDVTGEVKWYAEETTGITVDETTGAIEFTAPGTYQIYAVVNGKESNRVPLQVLPARYLDTFSVTGSIPDLIYNDDTANTFDLSKLTVTAKDQYGQDMTLDTSKFEWKLASDKGYAKIEGTTITGLAVGADTVTLYYPVGQDDQGETVYKTAQPLTVKVTAKGGSGDSGGSGGDLATYAITIAETKNGSVTASAKTAAQGADITLTVAPDMGYTLETLTVTDKDGKEVKLTEKNGKYTFTMPASNVTVNASFKTDSVKPVNPFTDVPNGAYYEDAVIWAVSEGITSGTTATTFSPDASCTRGQMVTFLWRAAGSPKASGSNPFSDVSADAYYYDAVLWAVKNGITSGTSATTFSPDATCTRAQSVTFLWRTAGSPAASGSSFSDVSSDAYYANAVAWAVQQNITTGTGNGKFSPNADCTRAQIVTFLYRAMEE